MVDADSQLPGGWKPTVLPWPFERLPGEQFVRCHDNEARIGDEAVVAIDVHGNGDRPKDEQYRRIAAENQARVAAGEELAPLIAGFEALVARQTVPEWRVVLDVVQQLDHVGVGPGRSGLREAIAKANVA